MDLSAILTDNVCRAPLTARHCLWPLARLRPEDIDSRPDLGRCPAQSCSEGRKELAVGGPPPMRVDQDPTGCRVRKADELLRLGKLYIDVFT